MAGVYENHIGGVVREREVNEALALLQMNKTLVVQKLTDDPPGSPEVVEGLNTLDKVFQHYKPNVEVEFEDKEGTPKQEKLNFDKVGDFGIKGILRQSEFLNGLQAEKDELFKFMKVLKSNKILQKILHNPEEKQAYIASLQSVLDEIKNS